MSGASTHLTGEGLIVSIRRCERIYWAFAVSAMLGGNGILLENHVIHHLVDIEALHTYEKTQTIHTLLVGRKITKVGALV